MKPLGAGQWCLHMFPQKKLCHEIHQRELQRKDEYPRTYKRKHRWTHSDWNCGFWKLVRPTSNSKFIFVIWNVWYNDILLEAVVQVLLLSPRGWFGLRTEVLGKFVWKNSSVMYNNSNCYRHNFVYYFIFLPPGLSIVCYTRTSDFLCPLKFN